jgi:hypothetical protein
MAVFYMLCNGFKVGLQKSMQPNPHCLLMNAQLFFQIMDILFANGESAVIHNVML